MIIKPNPRPVESYVKDTFSGSKALKKKKISF